MVWTSSKEDHSARVELTNMLSELGLCSNFKLRVSSRPWQEFQSRYGQLHGSLKPEDRTKDEIRRYVYGKLEDRLRDTAGIQSLAEDIVEKAEGVFLWVFLAVEASLNEQLRDVDLMRDRVAKLPPI